MMIAAQWIVIVLLGIFTLWIEYRHEQLIDEMKALVERCDDVFHAIELTFRDAEERIGALEDWREHVASIAQTALQGRGKGKGSL